MSNKTLIVLTMSCLALIACHKKAEPLAATTAAPAAASASAAPSASAATSGAATAAASAATAFDPASMPLSSTQLPPFPYLDWPASLIVGGKFTDVDAKFDRGYIAIGQQLRPVEGRVNVRYFGHTHAKLSELESRRNYENLVASLGAVKLPAADPSSAAFIQANGGDRYKIERTDLHLRDVRYSYGAYLIRRPDTNIWISLAVGESHTVISVIEEKAMEQTVGLVSAEDMARELGAKGRVALYINFDVDRATLRDDGAPVVEQIDKLLRAQPDLRLAIEGHTDNSGNAQHNKDLSRQRAETVLARLAASGIDKARLSAAGYGAERPLADNGTEEGRAKNRRVELVKR